MSEEDDRSIHNRLEDLPIQENFDDENGPEYMTSVVWEPMEHFIHNPERSLTEYNWTEDELRQVNWPAIKIAWQRLWHRWYHEQGGYTITLGKDGWADYFAGENKRLEFGEPSEPEEYDSERANDPKAIKQDYHWIRDELISKFGEYNKDNFGLPEDLYE